MNVSLSPARMEAPVRMELMVTSVCVLQDFWVSLVINGQEKDHVIHGTFKNIWTSRYQYTAYYNLTRKALREQ